MERSTSQIFEIKRKIRLREISMGKSDRLKICLIVLSPRVLPIAEEAFAKLPVDQFWIKHYTETQIEKLGIIKNFVDSTNYDYYAIESDDSIVPLASWNALIDVLKTSGKLLPVLSGWAEIKEKCKR